MSIYKRTYKSAEGKTADCSKYSVQFTDHTGKIRRIVAFSSRSASAELERSIKRLVNIRQISGIMESSEIKFLESCPAAILEKLTKYGIINGHHAGSAKSMPEHIEDFRITMLAKDGTGKHTKETIGYIKRAVERCGWRQPSEIRAEEYQEFLLHLRDSGLSLCTLNHSIRAVKAFRHWLKRVKVHRLFQTTPHASRSPRLARHVEGQRLRDAR